MSAGRADAQDEAGRMAWREGRRLALEGQPDSALAAYAHAGSLARSSGDQAIATAALRGTADVYAVYKNCADSSLRLLTEATASAAEGDRSAADALVRLLAAKGDLTKARSTLVKAYEDLPGVGRQVTRESVTFLQGMALIERFGGHESAAMSTLSSALQIAVRMHEGDAQDASSHAVGTVTAENAWVLYDLAELRLHAKSSGIASAREGTRMLDQLIEAWPTVTEHELSPFPVSRLRERLELRARACTRDGKSCPVPKPPKCS
jgi:tetratricopeptide (TPR) repeat protein